MRILIIEDEPDLASLMATGLRSDAYAVDVAGTAALGIDLATSQAYDLILLDRVLPDEDGLRVCQEIRAQGLETPILMVTALASLPDRVAGLDGGADDYLVKPFDFAELRARIRALVRRPLARAPVRQVADLMLDPASHAVSRGERAITLSRREFALLEHLMRHAGSVQSRTQLLEHVWEDGDRLDSNVVDVYIGYLRHKIDHTGEPALLQTVRGAGYVIGPPVASLSGT